MSQAPARDGTGRFGRWPPARDFVPGCDTPPARSPPPPPLLAAPARRPCAGPVTALPPANPPAPDRGRAGRQLPARRPGRRPGDPRHPRRPVAARVARRRCEPGGSPVTRGVADVRGRRRASTRARRRDQRRLLLAHAPTSPAASCMINGELIRDPEASRSSLVMLPGRRDRRDQAGLPGPLPGHRPDRRVTYPQRTLLGVNRPAKRGSETLLYTPAYGALDHADRPARATRCGSASTSARPDPRRPAPHRHGGRRGERRRHDHRRRPRRASPGSAPRARRWSRASRSASGSRITPGLLSLPPARSTPSAAAPRWCAAASAITNAGEGFTGARSTPRTVALGRRPGRPTGRSCSSRSRAPSRAGRA